MAYFRNDDTICAPATVPGTGAISVIRVSGERALEIAGKVVSCKNGDIAGSRGYTIRFGTVYDTSGEPVDEVLVSIFRAPHSYTGENSVEISCHASSYIAERILQLLMAQGARMADAGEFTLRAYLNGKMDLAQAEAVADLISSQSAAAHRVAYSQMKGGFSSELKDMRSQLLNIVSLMELELDFSEEEVEFADRTQLNALLDKVLAHIGRLMDSFRLGNAIRNGIPVAIAGATNAGKSTLLNALLGEERAIVSDIHGTTRDTIEETMNIDGILYRFIDTAGIRETDETVERIGIERTWKKLGEADIVLAMTDGTKDAGAIAGDLRTLLEKTDPSSQKVFVLVNKADAWDSGFRSSGAATSDQPDSSRPGASDPEITGDTGEPKSEISGGSGEPDSGILKGNKNVFSINNVVSCIENLGFACNAISDGQNIGGSSMIEVLGISAKYGYGTDTLRHTLASYSRDRIGSNDTTLITNARHYQALAEARTSLTRVREGLASSLPTDLVSQDIREALYHLGSIVGEISTDEVLGNIFRNFCIGK